MDTRKNENCSVGVGTVDPAYKTLMDVCEESVWRGIAVGSAGARLSEYDRPRGSSGLSGTADDAGEAVIYLVRPFRAF